MVIIQFTKFTNLNSSNIQDSISFGYRIYNEETSEYNNSFENLDELINTINKNTVIQFIQQYHQNFYEIIFIDGKFEFNGDSIIA